jgi:hypothetical protein
MNIKDLENLDFSEVPMDSFWNTGEEKEKKMHRIHAYPAKFPAFITTKAIGYAEKRGIKIKKIADVFCGCGTSAYESTRNSKDFWGCDINPVATLIARTKSHKYDNERIEKYYDMIKSGFCSSRFSEKDFSKVNERLLYWYKEDQIVDLYKMKNAIKNCVGTKRYYKDFFLCAFSNILKPTSKWLTKSIKPQIDPYKNPKNVLTAYEEQIKFMLAANAESDLVNKAKVEIINKNFLEYPIVQDSVDLLVTSPPYVTSYEYGDLHQLSTLWLNYANDYKKFRNGTIGSVFHSINFEETVNNLYNHSKNCVQKLWEVDKSKAKSVAKYFYDMQLCLTKCYDLVRNGGLALFVIGNTEYRNIKIKNAEHLAETMIKAGFYDIEVQRRKISRKTLTPYRDKRGRFSTDADNKKIYNEEFIIIGKK